MCEAHNNNNLTPPNFFLPSSFSPLELFRLPSYGEGSIKDLQTEGHTAHGEAPLEGGAASAPRAGEALRIWLDLPRRLWL